VATYTFCKRIEELKEQGVDFSSDLYLPEIHPVTGLVHHERGDHNYLLKRIAQQLRDGRYNQHIHLRMRRYFHSRPRNDMQARWVCYPTSQ